MPSWLRRLRQVARHLDPRPLPGPVLAWANRYLSPPEQRLFLAMRRSDQRHCVEVAQALSREEGLSLRERWVLTRAGLLHDVGKPEGNAGLLPRVAKVLVPPGRLSLLPPGLRASVAALRAHPGRGAMLLRRAGTELAVVALVRWHEEEDPSELPSGLRHLLVLLRRADSAK